MQTRGLRTGLVGMSMVLFACNAGKQEGNTTKPKANEEAPSPSTETKASTQTEPTAPSETSAGEESVDSGSSPARIEATAPADSTGVTAPLRLAFSTVGSAALGLQDVAPAVTITAAKISIGSVKVKADKASTEAEKQLRDEQKAARKAAEEAMKGEEEAIEQQMEDVKKSYEALKEAAASEQEKEALEDQQEQEVDAIEEQLAALKAASEEEEAKQEAARDGTLKWQGPFVYDAVSGAVAPELPKVELADGSYRRIEFKLRPNRGLAGADPLLNHSVLVEGSADVGGTPQTFRFLLDTTEEIRLMGAGAVKVAGGLENQMTIAFDVSGWFAGVDLSQATVGADGVVAITELENAAIWQQVKDRLKRSTRFGQDEDGDGKLGDEESEGDGEEGVEADEADEDESEAESAPSSDDEEQDDETEDEEVQQ